MSIAMQSPLQDWDTDDENNSQRPQRKKRKRKREPSNKGDNRLPKWCRYVVEPLRRKDVEAGEGIDKGG